VKDCNACGKCCVKYGGHGLSISQSEINDWDEAAPELLDYIQKNEIWFDPKTKQPFDQCPWLIPGPTPNVFHCKIYHNRPDDCRYYPSSLEEMIRDDCEMVEAKDLKNPKKAQQDLELIMKDSWV